jgi:protein-S-isoprenylcysteine O-methyltransferase Ste14
MEPPYSKPGSFWRSPAGIGLALVAVVGGFLLYTELGPRFPEVNLFGHEAGHLWWLLTGRQGDPHFGLLHILSFVALFAGFALLSKAWNVLYHAQRRHQLATSGPYRLIRHPQYVAFVIIMFGFLLQWPTLLTLAMFPVLVLMYVRLSISEERDSQAAFGDAWRAYAARTPRFLPAIRQRGGDAFRRGEGR